MEFVDNKNIKEDVEVDIEQHTEKIHLKLEMTRKNDAALFDYNIGVDEDGQLVFTPVDKATKFTDVAPRAGYDDTTDMIEGNVRHFAIDLDAVMSSEDNDFDWFYDIDDIGQVVLCPDSEDTFFISAAVADDLNLVTNKSLQEDIVAQQSEDSCLAAGLKELAEAVSKLQSIVDRLVACQNSVSTEETAASCDAAENNEPSGDTATDNVGAIQDTAEKLAAMPNVEGVSVVFAVPEKQELEEDLAPEFDEEAKFKVIDRFMKGDITIIQADRVPTQDTVVRLEELDDKSTDKPCEFYYDTESDVVVCVNKNA